MEFIKNWIRIINNYLTKTEKIIWLISCSVIIVSFFMFGGNGKLSLIASLIGVTSLILNAKGNPLGQGLMIIFSILYGIISLSFRYYGEMITYMGMTGPMAGLALIEWIKHPYAGNRGEVEVSKITGRDIIKMCFLAVVTTVVFYFILDYFNTSNMLFSTISVTTSFIGVYLTYKRSEYYALGYAANDVVLIILWTYATLENRAYVAVLMCFVTFFVNDIYGFVAWRRMKDRQGI